MSFLSVGDARQSGFRTGITRFAGGRSASTRAPDGRRSSANTSRPFRRTATRPRSNTTRPAIHHQSRQQRHDRKSRRGREVEKIGHACRCRAAVLANSAAAAYAGKGFAHVSLPQPCSPFDSARSRRQHAARASTSAAGSAGLFAHGGLACVRHLDPFQVGRGAGDVAVVPVPPFVRPGLRKTLR